MSRLSVSERMHVASLSADKSLRAAMSRLLYSPVLRWRYRSPVADHLLIVPQDLRTADPSFWHEVVLDHFGLAGTVAALDGRSPFDVRPPHEAWARALHGFGWLRHLGAAGHSEARDMACRLAVDWVERSTRSDAKFTWLPQVAARRVISWISHSDVILDSANHKSFDVVASSLGAQLVRLSAEWRDTPGGYPRLLVLIALVLADLAIAGHDHKLAEAEKAFSAELQRQILPDGGHISRNPRILVDLMLDLLPLRQCFSARGRPLPPGMSDAMQRMLTMLRFLRLGDGRLVRFNGTGVAASAGLATVLAYDERPSHKLITADRSRYVRLERGETIIITDSGPPPPLEFAGEAYAGCLSFEMSAGTELLFVNGGAPAPVDAGWRASARATVSHNTLCLGETSSSRLVRHRRLEAIIGAAPIREPDNVEYKVQERDTEVTWVGQHDGYVKRFGLRHSRRIRLDASGETVEGVDRLKDPFGTLRLGHDLPFSIHFHPHPDVVCQRTTAANVAELTLRDGEMWTFTLTGAALSVEEGVFFADSTGPTRVLQLIARGATSGDTVVSWVIAKGRRAAVPTPVPMPSISGGDATSGATTSSLIAEALRSALADADADPVAPPKPDKTPAASDQSAPPPGAPVTSEATKPDAAPPPSPEEPAADEKNSEVGQGDSKNQDTPPPATDVHVVKEGSDAATPEDKTDADSAIKPPPTSDTKDKT